MHIRLPPNTATSMPVYDRTEPDDPHVTEFDGGIEWLAQPDETGRRASSARPDAVTWTVFRAGSLTDSRLFRTSLIL